jgi:hypothetical protein
MKRRKFLQGLAAIGIGSAVIKPTIAEEVKPITPKPVIPKPVKEKKLEFVIHGEDLVAVLRNNTVEIHHKLKLIAKGYDADIPPYPRGVKPIRLMDRPISFISSGDNMEILREYFIKGECLQMKVKRNDGVIYLDIMIQEIQTYFMSKPSYCLVVAQAQNAIIFEANE